MILKILSCLFVPIVEVVASIYCISHPLKCNDAFYVKCFHKNQEIKKYTHRIYGIVMLPLSIIHLLLAVFFLVRVLNEQMILSIASLYIFLLTLIVVLFPIIITYIMYKIRFDQNENYKVKIK